MHAVAGSEDVGQVGEHCFIDNDGAFAAELGSGVGGQFGAGPHPNDDENEIDCAGEGLATTARTRDRTYPRVKYRRLAPRIDKQKALVALQYSILTAVWHVLTYDVDYQDLGGDYFARLDPERAMRRIVRQANALGYAVRFDPIQAAYPPTAATPDNLNLVRYVRAGAVVCPLTYYKATRPELFSDQAPPPPRAQTW